MQSSHRRLVGFSVVAIALLAIGAANTKCDAEAVKPLLLSLREIHMAIDDLEDAVCTHYQLSGDGDVAPDFCPSLDPCSEPMDVGPCDAAIPRWYFDTDAGECRRFIWGGCQANGNNFVTKEECEGTCDPCEADCGPTQRCVRDGDCSGEICDYCADTCNGVRCDEGEHCELVEVQCFTTPCPPVAQCVPNEKPTDPCADLVCDDGYHCEFMSGVVVACVEGAPCLPPVACIPDDDPCDDAICLEDERCEHDAFSCPIDDPACEAWGDAVCVPRNPCGDRCEPGVACLIIKKLTPFEDEHTPRHGRCGDGLSMTPMP